MSNQQSDLENDFQLSTFGIPAAAQYARSVTSEKAVKKAVQQASKLKMPVRPVGEGSNTVLSGSSIDKYLLHVNISGQEMIDETENAVRLKVGAGENWDNLVEKTVEAGWSGVAALSAIPGSVGAAPVQNIGAYGQELSDVLESVRVYDVKAQKTRSFDKQDCDFGYRDSRFKQSPGLFIILAVTLKLQKQDPEIPEYAEVQKHFADRSIDNPTVRQIREVVTKIRWSKLPRPKQTPNVGSFFKNPVVSESKADNLQDAYPNIPMYEQEGGIKIPAGWLIEEVGLKGEWFGTVGIHEDNALILVSKKQAKFADLARMVSEIRHRVRGRFGIELEREPRVLV